MKKLLDPEECAGKLIQLIILRSSYESILCSADIVAIHFTDDTAIVFKAFGAGDGTEFLKVCQIDDIYDLDAEQLGLQTQQEIEAEREAKRDKRLKKFLELKAEFEPS